MQYILPEIPGIRKHSMAIPSCGAIVGNNQKMLIAEQNVQLAAEFAFSPFAEHGYSWWITVGSTEYNLIYIPGNHDAIFRANWNLQPHLTNS